MAGRIEDYAMIGDGQTAALVGRDGSIDWLCFWRFDAAPCFAALLGTPENGRFLLSPQGGVKSTRRRYREGTLVLETEFETEDGVVVVVDFMPDRSERRPHLVRIVEGKRGRVPMHMELAIRFDYGLIVPWVRVVNNALRAIGGNEAVRLVSPVVIRGKDMTSVADFIVGEGDRVPFTLSWNFSYEEPSPIIDPFEALEKTAAMWQQWSKRSKVGGEWREPVQRSLITLKALTNQRTGGIVAAPTTSLPEQIGGVRNWDYRYCWVRDATFTLLALLQGGYKEEAAAWREWLLRAIAGKPGELQIMYGVGGERRLTEMELPWLAGYEGSKPVRVGNAAWVQTQIDVYGELMDAMYHCQKHGLSPELDAWNVQRMLLDFLETAWTKPDEGIWEVRGGRQHFTHSKMMAWVAVDRGVKTVESFGAEGPLEKWKRLRRTIFDEVCNEGFDRELGSFTQVYGQKGLDASLLMMPLVGFLPATDPRVAGTVQAVQRELTVDGFVRRYSETAVDGVQGEDGMFIPCTFWLADCLALMGKPEEARATFERLLAIRNDVGLFAEEFDPRRKRMLGNFPQAFSHIAMINTALALSREESPGTHPRAM